MKLIENDWMNYLKGEFEKEYFKRLMEFLDNEYENKTIYPPKDEVFSALNTTSYKDTLVVILGQDPYHKKGQAHGMSFSVRPGVQIPPSLVNIFKELKDSLGCDMPNNGYLLPWAQQGVLLLNTVLTVEEGKAGSHHQKGWEIFTDYIIKLLNEKEQPVIFLLWGTPAKKKMSLITNPQHKILTTVHPSPLSAYRGFLGCNHFKEVNEYLVSWGKKPIDWQIR
ncbi:MAG: uracil-DNA glycosylase [Cellulosilyticaceae bacterium]